MYLFDKDQVKRFFNALENKGRRCEPRYLGWDKKNPHIQYCEREIFIKRLSSRLLKSRYLKIYNTDKGVFSYVFVNSIRYALNYGCALTVYYLDYSRLDLGFQQITLNSGDVICLEGEFTNGEEHKKLSDMLILNLPDKTFRFKAYDFTRYPKRVRKGTDPKEKIKTTVDIKARSIQEAFNKRKDFPSSMVISEEFEIIQ